MLQTRYFQTAYAIFWRIGLRLAFHGVSKLRQSAMSMFYAVLRYMFAQQMAILALIFYDVR